MELSDFHKQKGLIPTLIWSIGFFLHAFFILGSLYFVIPTIIDFFMNESFLNASILSIGFVLFIICGVWSVPLIAGAIFVNAFPDLRCTENGIETRFYKIFKTTFTWNELQQIIDAPHEINAIVIKRRGFNLVNGLYSNQIYGHNIKSKHPVLLLSSGLENRGELISYIKTKISLKTVQR
jgi:hypothetical protein